MKLFAIISLSTILIGCSSDGSKNESVQSNNIESTIVEAKRLIDSGDFYGARSLFVKELTINAANASANLWLKKIDSMIDSSNKSNLDTAVHDTDQATAVPEKVLLDLQKIIGIKYDEKGARKLIDKYGSPTTLVGTNNQSWIAYFEKGDFTIVLEKSTKRIIYAQGGNVPNLSAPIDIDKISKTLYTQMMRFKNNADFHKYGFTPGTKYHEWLLQIEEYENEPENKDLLSKGYSLGDIKMLALEYIQTRGRENDYTRFTRGEISKGQAIK